MSTSSVVYPGVSAPNEATLPLELGQALVFASVQPALASMQMSSRFDIVNSATTQDLLEQAARDLRSFMIIAIIWAVGSTLVMYIQFSWRGAFINLVGQGLVGYWIFSSFRNAIVNQALRKNLQVPSVWGKLELKPEDVLKQKN